MKNILMGLAAAAMLVGCGGNLCDKSEDASKDFSDNTKECSMLHSDYKEPTQAEKDTCKTNLDKCSDSDKDKLQAFIDCTSDLGVCKASEQDAYTLKLVACLTKVKDLSAACQGIVDSGS
ncbi:hypothetical protein DRW03_11750 [Corallococcus sp. H22C18031201]|uniref:hypothetical protein n=1 Tax=Citreicoccus inhibens TaxID=2849499 RepID=UPI000E71F6C2|nr:hypothetical protein [Citreicoccus inhibens]MBU8894309.1 hypothetical protein [Citreicoccus inhibens]RJS23004.1 hypothetical protein DRW03_11750 [Corallococcus sp. H22C18031201]